jgi:hypothetical protein
VGLADARESPRLLAAEFDRAGADRLAGNITIEEPPLRLDRAPVAAPRVQQLGREHHVAILPSLSLIHTDHHPLTVDVGRFQANGLGDAQAGRVTGGQDRPMFSAADALKKLADFLRTQHNRQFLRLRVPE